MEEEHRDDGWFGCWRFTWQASKQVSKQTMFVLLDGNKWSQMSLSLVFFV